MYLSEDTDIPKQFLKAATYEEIVVVGGSAKGCNNLNVNSSSRIIGLTFCWNDELQNAIKMECVSSSKGMSDIKGTRQDFLFSGVND